MPELFTRAFANRLDGLCNITVKEAETNDTVIARTRAHRAGQSSSAAQAQRRALLRRSQGRPSGLPASALGRRAVPLRCPLRRAKCVGVILTGMGDDGARGMLEMKQAGAKTIAQDEATCIVFGMPKEAIKLNGVDKILPLQSIAGAMLSSAR
jgi:two-component system chemotaxis response regulator CheB